jgi:hypothetical protein
MFRSKVRYREDGVCSRIERRGLAISLIIGLCQFCQVCESSTTSISFASVIGRRGSLTTPADGSRRKVATAKVTINIDDERQRLAHVDDSAERLNN